MLKTLRKKRRVYVVNLFCNDLEILFKEFGDFASINLALSKNSNNEINNKIVDIYNVLEIHSDSPPINILHLYSTTNLVFCQGKFEKIIN